MARRKSDDGLRPLFRTNVLGDWVTIESGLTDQGIPDSQCCIAGSEFWLEYKSTRGWAVRLRPEQIGWHLRRQRHGGRTFIACRRRVEAGKRRGAADTIFLFPGRYAEKLASGGLRLTPPIYVGNGGPSCWNWAEIARLLSDCKK